MNPQTNQNTSQAVEVSPKIPFLTFLYFLFSLPSFIFSIFIGIISIFLILVIIIGSTASNNEQNSLNYENLESLSAGDVKSSTNKDTILIYELNGAISTGDESVTDEARINGVYTNIVKKDFEIIKNDSNIKNVVFRVNTPGGSVFASEILGDLIKDLLTSKNQTQAVFYFDQVVASGGLWAAYKLTDNYVVGSPYGQTGSIGVVLSVPNFEKLADNVGYKETVIKSGPSKDYGNPLRDLTSEETKFLQSQVDVQYEKFVNIVATGRKLDNSRVKSFANGYVYENKVAKDYGLLDELGGIDISIKKAASNLGIDTYNVKRVKTEVSPFGGIFASSNIPKILGLDGINEVARKITKTQLEPGIVYAIDETRI